MRGARRAAVAAIALWVVGSGAAPALAQDPRASAAPAATIASFSGVQSLRNRALATLASVPERPVAVAAAAAQANDDAGTPPYVTQAYACLIGGTASMVVAYAAGAENLVNTIAGGIVPTANRGVLFMGVAGIVFASFCALGEALTPVYLYYAEREPQSRATAGPRRAVREAAAPTRSVDQAGVLGSAATIAARRIGLEPAAERPFANALAQLPAPEGR